ncbi:MAG TPA: PaaI family thioesterase [Ottowia sp.]|uniref:PaaI family thioesterase n=1 Tax=Ottowia sp. TaxID=1898956 RepID=UPI002C7A2FF5|nr:PaaI family thioesterase [Ottowia sp.]HMN22259.1 PaaI family thioesterase [Ottowia sp.]
MESEIEHAAPAGFHPLVAGGEFIRVNGPLYLRHEGADVRFGLRVAARHCNPMGVLHGGMTASFCDMLIPLSVHRKHPELGRRFLPTISLQVDYLAPAPLGCWLEGTAELLRATRTLVFAQGLVTADGVPCARASGVFKIGPEFPDGLEP